MFKKLSLISLSAISAFAMNSFEINISDKDLGIYTQMDMGQFVHTIRPQSTYIGFSFLDANQDHSQNFHKNIRPFFEISFLKIREISEKGLSIGLGMKANYTKNYSALPLGAELRYKLPVSDTVPMNLNASLYYAPEVLSVLDARECLEIGVNLYIEVIENGLLNFGYRRIETNYEYSTYRMNAVYNQSLHLGYKFEF